MSGIKFNDIVKLIAKAKKITDIDQKTYHKRLHLSSTMSSPTADISVNRTSGPFSSPENLKIIYSCEEIYITKDKNEIEALIELTKSKEDELKNSVIEKKMQEFLKLIDE